jgi:CRP-like cAMP-binding protein
LSFGNNSIKIDEVIIPEQQPCDVQLNVNGTLQIEIDGKIIATLPANSLVGEISFLTGKPSIASVKVLGEAEMYSWNRNSLLQIQKKYPAIYIKFYEILLNNVASKLTSANKMIHLLTH